MRFKVDENLPIEVCQLLRDGEHDAISVLDQREDLGGAPDSQLHGACCREERVLITLDVGFADIRTYPPAQTPGAIVLRLIRQDKSHVLGVVRSLLPVLAEEPPARRLWIVEEERIRVRS